MPFPVTTWSLTWTVRTSLSFRPVLY